MPDDIATDALELHANAWCGEEAHGALVPKSLAWGARRDLPQARRMLAPRPIDISNWRDPLVGWGLVVPDDDQQGTEKEKARGADLCQPLRDLVCGRENAPIFHYRRDLAEGRLRRYAPDGTHSDPGLSGKRGIGPDAVPRYLLIAASPAQIPWSFQYRLQTDAFVGRLDLDEQGLGRYVEALLGDWPCCKKQRNKPLVWAVDHGHPDITRLMRKTIAERLAESFAKDPDAEFAMTGGLRSDGEATHTALIAALTERDPAFVMTSSHGATFPLDDPAALRATLGLPVDQARTPMNLAALSAWNPYGAIWYAHACCSAGADGASRFAGIVGADSTLGRTLTGIASAGACQAPLPRALLGGANPMRAFVGHVEPTFDWTLRDPVTGQSTTQSIIDAFYGQLHLASSPPIGLALKGYFEAVGGLLQDYGDAIDALNAHVPGADERARRSKLIACDRLAMVILGDPTVRLPSDE